LAAVAAAALVEYLLRLRLGAAAAAVLEVRYLS
jgi:hypothetical protein